MTDQLFEWELPQRRSRSKPQPQLVDRPPGWFAVTNRSGVQGFHLTSIPDEEYARNRSIMTLCGIIGRRLAVFPNQIILCDECVKQRAKGKQGALQ